jgi:MFS family permease
VTPDTQIDRNALSISTQFLQQNWLRICASSVGLLVPVYWHWRIEAGDLPSHVYNAWLVHLIHRGLAPGLWVAPQSNNILFDVMLSQLGDIFGLRVAERIAVSFAVMIFFWGAFALIAASSRRPPWFLVPAIAIFTYGWTFEMGLMNYYLSLGLSFFALAYVWHSIGRGRFISLVLVPFIWMAHPLGVIWLVGSAVYIILAGVMPSRHHWYLLMTAGIFITITRMFLVRNYQVGWPNKPFYLYNGADQLVLFSTRYYVPAGFFIAFATAALAIDIHFSNNREILGEAYRLPSQLYILAGMASVLLPSSVALPHYNAPITLLTQRLSSVLGIVACCVLGVMRPRKWHFMGFSLIASIFFSYLYQDTGIMNRMEEQVERAVSALPRGHLVLGEIWPRAGSRIVIQHIVDRACIAHCFSYANFEPSTGQFRVRAMPGNSIVTTRTAISAAQPVASELPQFTNPPVYGIYPCYTGANKICVHELSTEEVNGLIGVEPTSQLSK